MRSTCEVGRGGPSHLFKRGKSELEPHDQPASGRVQGMIDARRRPRFKIDVEISINSRTCGLLTGHTGDISESGIAAMLRIEVPFWVRSSS
jgi:hypothetical protein